MVTVMNHRNNFKLHILYFTTHHMSILTLIMNFKEHRSCHQKVFISFIPSGKIKLIYNLSRKQHKILSPQKSSEKELPGLRHSRYLTTFHDQLNKKKERFRKSRGEFTQFIQKNNKFKPLGPLHGDQRDETRIEEAKRSVWIKPSKSMCDSTKHSFLQSTDLNFSIKSSISKNSQLLTEKQRIRQIREKTYVNYRKSLEKRKTQKPNSHLFELPKNGPQHELTLVRPMHRFSLVEKKMSNNTQHEQLYKDISSFDVKMYQKFK